ncbi:transposase [Bradyrhizobium algeriense]|uniref:transposase n=1 Tax=Bradyrhizobium algeriense TaxID=634784 RepID=UPI000D372A65|nr:transposase [Bradyrhizobium algeriense]
MSEHRSDTKNFEVITATPERLPVSPGRSHRTWSREAKERIVGETFAPGANVSAIARAHGLDPSQVFAWRRKALASGIVAPRSERARPIKFARFEAVAGETMEIVVGDVAVRIGSDVEPERLAAVIRAVRQA